jgi:serine/threonine protein kinase
MFLQIGDAYYEFLPHPLFPDDSKAVFVLEGGTAFIYKLRHVDTGEQYALKVFKRDSRNELVAYIAVTLTHYTDLPEIQASKRLCLTPKAYPELVSAHPEMAYAVLMPWLDAPTWTGILLNPQTSAAYTREQALSLARATANLLSKLETHGIAHADIAGGNVVPAIDRQQVQLLDPENMYLPKMPIPRKVSQGTPGYQHQHLGPHGQWCPEGDRFAGAILLAEMLTWWNPRVRARVADDAETVFRPEELQAPEAPCLQAVRDTIYTLSPSLLELFDRAWLSRTLADCPLLRTWAATLLTQSLT